MGYVMSDIFSKRGDTTVKYAMPFMPEAYEVKVSSGEFLIDETPVPITYTLGIANVGQASNPLGMTLDKFLSQFEGVDITTSIQTAWIYLLEGEDGGKITLTDSSGTAKEFKTNAIELLKFCLAETKETAISDELGDEELELSDAYCEGLEDAIKKIASLPTE